MVLALAVAVLATMVVAVVLAMIVVAEMKTEFSSKSPPQLPGVKHPTLNPAMMLTLPM